MLEGRENVLGDSVLESKGESPAIWLSNKKASEERTLRKRKLEEADLE